MDKWPPIIGWLLIKMAAHSRFYCNLNQPQFKCHHNLVFLSRALIIFVFFRLSGLNKTILYKANCKFLYYHKQNAWEHSICIRINVDQLAYIHRPKSPPSPWCQPAIMPKSGRVPMLALHRGSTVYRCVCRPSRLLLLTLLRRRVLFGLYSWWIPMDISPTTQRNIFTGQCRHSVYC